MAVSVIRVSSESKPHKVAGSIARFLREAPELEVRVIGAGALNQAIKAIAIARGFIAENEMDIEVQPAFEDIKIEGEERTAVKLLLKRVSRSC